jgi:hypothetical protein
MKLLISGVPGAGKTCIGDFLKNEHGFMHIDLEKDVRLLNLVHSTDEFIKTLPASNVVMTWGFMPKDDNSIIAVLALKASGFKIVWFDGNREASRREFIRRNTVSLDNYKTQINNINESEIVKMINPFVYNTFDNDGCFKSQDIIYSDLKKLNKSSAPCSNGSGHQ